MIVKELIEKLKTFDSQLEILCYCEDLEDMPEDQLFRLFDINGVDVGEAEKTRLVDGTPYFRLGKTPHSQHHILLDISAKF